tara:strand:+ start:75 stop:323 length:249 start_codon:yes stop_codon:yes gene_type:complete
MSNQKWEYLVKEYKDNLEEELNKLGKIGWELISVQGEQTKYICVFKKSIPIKVKSKTELKNERRTALFKRLKEISENQIDEI